MAKYIRRTTAPAVTDKNYINFQGPYNGYSAAVAINKTNGYTLANCVGYAWGRWREFLGKWHNLYAGNASGAYGNTKDGYARGQIPKLGAVACFGGGTNGDGHVAIVEAINRNSNGSIKSVVYGNSGYYSGRTFYELEYADGQAFAKANGYTFQGYIYCPVEFE